MKRQALFVIAAASVLAACDGFKEALSAHADVVAKAGSQELSVERLAELLGNSQIPLQKEVAKSVAGLWVDYQLLATAAAKSDSLKDTKRIDDAMWSVIAQEKTRLWGEQVMKTLVKPTPPPPRSATRRATCSPRATSCSPSRRRAHHGRQGLDPPPRRVAPRPGDACQLRAARHAEQHGPGLGAGGRPLRRLPQGPDGPEFEKALLALQPARSRRSCRRRTAGTSSTGPRSPRCARR
jgi:peptidyl-prolyl cis-trans isomerase D